MSKKNILISVLFCFILSIFFLKGVIFLDPDLGWHLRYGELILSSGIPHSDPFSYTMPSYNYANHSWLLDTMFALLYPLIGLEGLSLIFATAATTTIFLSVSAVKATKLWRYSFIFLASAIFLSFTGIRPQIVSWLLFVVVIKIIQAKRLLILPLIFLLWANVHAGFLLGLATLLIYIISNFISEKKAPIKAIYVFFLSVAVTLINPYQLKLWQEAISIVSDTRLKLIIEEWYPIILAPHPLIIIWILIFIFFFIKQVFFSQKIKNNTKLSIFEKILYLVVCLNSLSSVRNTPYFVLATLPFFIISLEKYTLGLKGKLPFILYEKIPLIIFLFFITIFLLNTSQTLSQSSSQSYTYPADAVAFLKKQTFGGEVFAPYHWGGFLIWQLPQRRVFIDGRMASWRQEEKKGESSYALEDYLSIFSTIEKQKEIFNKYNINIVLLPNFSQKSSTVVGKIIKDWQNNFTPNYSTFSLAESLEKQGWEKIYSDEVAVIYKR